MAGVVLADAGSLIALACLASLHLLQCLFGRVVIPTAVHAECMAKDTEDSRRIAEAITQGWLLIETPTTPPPALHRGLGEGEKQAIGLALSRKNALLILDDRLARRQAASLGLAFIGTVRLLWIAEQRGLAGSAEAALETLRQGGYRISPEVLRRIREEAG